MSLPTSAFSIYKVSNKLNQPKIQNKKKKKRNAKSNKNVQLAKVDLSQEQMIKVGKKLKEKTKDKNVNKKKTHKRKIKDRIIKVISPSIVKHDTESSDNEEKFQAQPIINKIEFPHELILEGSEESFDFTPVQTHSGQEGAKVFKWLIAPYNMEEFFKRIWEKKPLHISRNKDSYYKEIISTPIIDDMIRNNNVYFTKNIDITTYSNGQRETHNPLGRAHPNIVWDFYLNGCSVRLLNPQTFIPQLHCLNATLQELTHSFVGANAYLTPPDSQGFAPHYDDIEAFILQIEGKKHWRIYKPLSDDETLPRISSKNFNQHEIGNPILEVTLEAGDMLYFPRGYIHQAVTIDGEHSLHVTLSMYQKHSWADLFEQMLPIALETAINKNVELRQGLPFNIYSNFGVVNSDVSSPRKQDVTNHILFLFDKIKDCLSIDSGVDQMSKRYHEDALPPVLTDAEKAVSVYGDHYVMLENGKVTRRVEIDLDTKIRLLRKNIMRMVMEESIKLYYYTENSLEYHGNETQFLEIDESLAPAVESLIKAYPNYISVESLDVPDDEVKIQMVNDFWDKGLIMTEYPLPNIEDD